MIGADCVSCNGGAHRNPQAQIVGDICADCAGRVCDACARYKGSDWGDR